MSQPEHAYPAAEERPKPVDALEQLDEELRLYASPTDIRANLVGLLRLYQETPIMQGFQHCAYLVAKANIPHGLGTTTGDISKGKDFLAGCVLATHCLLRPISSFDRHGLYFIDPLEVFSDYAVSVDDEDSEAAMQVVADFHDTFWEESFSYLDDAAQEKILEAAVLVYGDQVTPQTRENSFIAGFMFANECIPQM